MQNDDLNGGTKDSGPSLLLTMMEAAAQLRLGRTQTYELVMGGRIPSVTIGRRRLVVRTGLEEFIRELIAEQGLIRAL
jgi:excisionase family DNA binding protein